MEFDLGLKLSSEEIRVLTLLIDNPNLTNIHKFMNENEKCLKSLEDKKIIIIQENQIDFLNFKEYFIDKITSLNENKSNKSRVKKGDGIETHKSSKSNDLDIEPIKSYLINAQKQICRVDTDIKLAILTLRKMIDNLIDQIKNQIDNTFSVSTNNNSEIGEWISIPHVSPIGFYEPIYELNKKFSELFDELNEKMINSIDNFCNSIIIELIQSNKDNLDDDKLSNKLDQKTGEIKDEISNFLIKVNDSISSQIKNLETNLGKDLIEQFDAIERLNDLNPERTYILLNKAHNDFIKSINGFYSRIIREVNSVQKQADFSALSLILTNEAGKMLKTIDSKDGIADKKQRE